MPEPEQLAKAGFKVKEWCSAAGFSVPLYFILKRSGSGPHETNIGRAVIIIEPPLDFLKRYAAEHPQTKPPGRSKPIAAPIPTPAARRLPTRPTAPAKRARVRA